MWPDNETDRDFLNFTGIAETVAEIIVQAKDRPISIGVTGDWGSGKSSLIKLIKASLVSRSQDAKPFVFVEFNAWLYQGYDDARAALMECIANALQEKAEERKTGVDKAKDLLERIDWFRAAKWTIGAVALAHGIPALGLLGGGPKAPLTAKEEEDRDKRLQESSEKLVDASSGLLRPGKEKSPPREISALRSSFQDTLKDIGVTLVVLIDDLDRCLPETTISTLEAIRLFLFLENAAFVVAADDRMIKAAVKKHFDGASEDQTESYFDKLIQVPIRVPALGTQEIRAYLMLLQVQNSTLDEETKKRIRLAVIGQLRQSWQGKRVDRSFMESLYGSYPSELIGRFDSAERLAPMMASSTRIAGNPRLIKRFLNALAIRISISRAQGVDVDEAVLVKMLLLERIDEAKALAEIVAAVSSADDGKPRFLAAWEEAAAKGDKLELGPPWNQGFVEEWLRLSPPLADRDLRGALYVSREHSPLITLEDRMSSEGIEILTGLLQQPEMAASLEPRLKQLPQPELNRIMGRLLERARQETEWGIPPILIACLTVVKVEATQGQRLAGFLKERPIGQVKASLVPKIGDEPWAKNLLAEWSKTASHPVRRAIDSLGGR